MKVDDIKHCESSVKTNVIHQLYVEEGIIKLNITRILKCSCGKNYVIPSDET